MADSKEKKEIVIDRRLCKGCGICVAFCPQKVLELDDNEKARAVFLEKCNACALCELRCPDIAIEMKEKSDIPKKDAGNNEIP